MTDFEYDYGRDRLASGNDDWMHEPAAMIQSHKLGLAYGAGQRAEREAIRQRIEAADDLLRRLSEWDHLPLMGDGPFWLREIARVREALAAPAPSDEYPPQIECGAHERFACEICWPPAPSR